MQRAIHNHKGDVYDPFIGSGTTLIAGEQEGRTVFAIEIEPAYVDVTVTRWEDFTGRKATLKRGTPWLGNIARFHGHPLGSARRLPGRFRQGPRGKHSAWLCAACRP